MSRVVIIDNFDSFVYNIAQYVGERDAEVCVVRNNTTFQSVMRLRPDRVIISPGPGHPQSAGVSLEILRHARQNIDTGRRTLPILGICLGHQAIGYVFGARIVRGSSPVHGKVSSVIHDGSGVFRGLACPLTVTRYHSLVIDPNTLPAELKVTARTEDGTIMALAHQDRSIVGLQFHPESILTQGGRQIIANYLEM
ncbi:MAG: aminodeoxychorismate/anthranilate synthase component II [Candidatus Thorarchaeota archaeon]|nr:aminodeoxychorismate/anthranilate synthase component II [Candidatus Thorarchaeota archaeon]